MPVLPRVIFTFQLSARTPPATGDGSGEAILLLPATLCFVATVEGGDRSERAVAFGMEPALPIDAEAVVAVASPGGERRLGVAVDAEAARTFVEQVEAGGETVVSLQPAALAASQALGGAAARVDVWREHGDGGLSFVAMRDGAAAGWWTCGDEPTALRQRLELARRTAGIDDADEAEPRSMTELADAIARQESPWCELRVGRLGGIDRLRGIRPALNGLLAAAAVLLIVVSGTLWLRGGRYAETTRQADAEVAAAFAEAFPDRPMPVAPLAVLRSERRLRQQAEQASSVMTGRSALDVLAEIAPLVGEGVEVETLVAERGSVMVSIASADPTAGSGLTAALTEAGWRVEPATTQRREDGRWEALITAARPTAEGR